MGCYTGDVVKAFEYYKNHRAITEEDYPYTGIQGDCQYDTLMADPATRKTGVYYKFLTHLPATDINAMKYALTRYPI